MRASRSFPRSFESIDAIFAFTAAAFAEQRLDTGLLPIVDLVVEELFTNMVKYGTRDAGSGDADVCIELAGVGGGVEVTLTERGARRFDVSRAPDVDVTLPIEQRRPGGLGLHLVRRMAESIVYAYSADTRQGRTTVRIAGREPAAAHPSLGETMLAIEYGRDGAVVMAGRLDAAQAGAAQTFLDDVQGQVTVDMSRLEYISSAGLGVLLKTQKRLLASAGKLRLTGVQPHLRDVFTYSGLDQLFEIDSAG